MFTTECRTHKIGIAINHCETKKWDSDPEFQRDTVWSLETKQLCIKSVMDGLPIGTPTLVNTSDEKWLVIDGKQRLTTLTAFKNGDFKTGDTESTKPSDPAQQGKTFEELSEVNQMIYLETSMCFQECNPKVVAKTRSELQREYTSVIDLFRLLNVQGKKLTSSQLFASCLTDKCAPDSMRFMLKVFFNKIEDTPIDEQEKILHIRSQWASIFGKPGEEFTLNTDYNTTSWKKWCTGSGLPLLSALVVSFCTGNNHAITTSFSLSYKNGLSDELDDIRYNVFYKKMKTFFAMVKKATDSRSESSLVGKKSQIPAMGSISVYMYITNLIHSSIQEDREKGEMIKEHLPKWFEFLNEVKQSADKDIYICWDDRGRGNRNVKKLVHECSMIQDHISLVQ